MNRPHLPCGEASRLLRALLPALLVAAASLHAGCASTPEPVRWLEVEPPYTEERIAAHSEIVVLTRDRFDVHLRRPHLIRDEQGEVFEGVDPDGHGTVRVPAGSALAVEGRNPEHDRWSSQRYFDSLIIALGFVAGILLGFGV